MKVECVCWGGGGGGGKFCVFLFDFRTTKVFRTGVNSKRKAGKGGKNKNKVASLKVYMYPFTLTLPILQHIPLFLNDISANIISFSL